MSKVKVYNLEGQEIEETRLDPVIFAVNIQPSLVHQVVEIQQANARQILAHTKGRAEVRGGGKKPWKQKGTGRARHGSSRSPIWVGGGVTFGPTNERNFSKQINKKMKKKALFMTLTDKVNENRFVIVDDLRLEKIKTKDLFNIFKKLPVKEAKSTLVILEKKDEIIYKSSRNLNKVKTILADSLNVLDVLNHDYLLLDKKGLAKIIKTYK